MSALSAQVGNRISSTNVTFLLGSGVSRPLLGTLGNIESLLDQAEAAGSEAARVLRHEFFAESIAPSLRLLISPIPRDARLSLEAMTYFYRTLQGLLFRRDSATEGMRARVFTTNYDPISELALEKVGLDYEDGFAGRLKPQFDIGNYGTVRYMRSLHYATSRESPTVDLHKLHGSITWKRALTGLEFDGDMSTIRSIQSVLDANPISRFAGGISGKSVADLEAEIARWTPASHEDFDVAYDQLAIVNPSSAKYSSTVLEQAYYDQLRILSNELERTNSSMFVLGFSFEDVHIRDLIIRGLDTNPTLSVYIFAYDAAAETRLRALLSPEIRRNRNVRVVAPTTRKVRGVEKVYPWDVTNFTRLVLQPNVTVGSTS